MQPRTPPNQLRPHPPGIPVFGPGPIRRPGVRWARLMGLLNLAMTLVEEERFVSDFKSFSGSSLRLPFLSMQKKQIKTRLRSHTSQKSHLSEVTPLRSHASQKSHLSEVTPKNPTIVLKKWRDIVRFFERRSILGHIHDISPAQALVLCRPHGRVKVAWLRAAH